MVEHATNGSQVPPPPATGSVVFVGAIAAVLGSVAWALVRHLANVEHGFVAWGIGGLVGFAMIWRKASTQPQALAAGLLALASIVCGKYSAFRLMLDQSANESVAVVDEDSLVETRKTATAWAALGVAPTDAQVRDFATAHGFEVETPAAFRADTGAFLSWIETAKPDAKAVRERLLADMTEQASFVEHLKEDFHPLDVLFAFLGVSTAYGMVRKAMHARLAAGQVDAAPPAA